MLLEKEPLRYYLFAFSNFLAAFGGGMILGKGVGVINTPFLQNGAIMAFFIGTVLGLTFLQSIPKKLSQLFSRWFSIGGGLASLLLFNIFESHSINGKLIGIAASVFFILLSIRFGLWFYSRVLRASNVAGQQQRIAWVELGYYSGMIFGLIIWKFLGIDFSIATALLIDATLQFSAGALDLRASQIPHHERKHNDTSVTNLNNKQQHKEIWEWRLASAAVFLTIGVQVVIFSLTHYVSDYLSAYILASFYAGASIAAVFCKKLKIQLAWKRVTKNDSGYAIIYSEKNGVKKEISIILLGILSAFCVTATIVGANYSPLNLISGEALLLTFIFCSAFFYEILALAILDRIGLEEQLSNHHGMVVRTYGMMGISAAISLWVFGLTKSSLYGLLFTVGVSIVSAGFVVWKRSFAYSTIQCANLN